MTARLGAVALHRFSSDPMHCWLFMLLRWQQWDPTSVPGSALSQWLVGIEVEHGPDGLDSPTYLKQNFNVQEAADLYQAVHLGTLEDLFCGEWPLP